jgi:single stranded DNA-binding protein
MKERWTVNKVLLAGRLTRDPEMRALASGKHVTQFSVATTEYAGNGKERPEFHNVVTWVPRPLDRTRQTAPRP